MKIKHSKFRNTGILFELLIRQITSDTLSNKDSAAVNLVKKYFNKTELAKEYKIYQTLVSSKLLSESKAETFINAALDASLRLNKSTLRKEKYNLIKEIKENYNLEEFFKAKINNYTQHAAAYNLIESHSSTEFIDPQYIIDNKITLLEHITRKEINKENVETRVIEEYMSLDKGSRILAYRMLLEKFNTKYAKLSDKQKIVLKEYINNVTNTIKLREFVNNNFNIITKELKTLIPNVEDKTTQIKLTEITNFLQPLDKNQNVKDENIISLLQFYQLLNELKIIK
jgi:ABC-type antimicrobial peptide transport system permease subunit